MKTCAIFEKVFANYLRHNRRHVIGMLIISLAVLALALRVNFIHYQSHDYTVFLSPWYDFLASHGIHSFKYNFSNYNVPYLYLLYASTFLPVSKIIAIKLISILFDLVLAIAIYLIVHHFKPKEIFIPLSAACISLFLPTVFMNSSLWGQCDSIYTSLLLFSFYFLISNKPIYSWVFWGLAFSFKLQAIFLLPLLVIFYLRGKSVRIWHPLVALIPFCVTTFSPLLFGKPLHNIFWAYTAEVQKVHYLTYNSANLYQWLPNSNFVTFKRGGIILTLAVIVLFLIGMLLKKVLTDRDLLIAATLVLYLTTFFLPAMHDRYTYPAEVFGITLAFILPKTFWIPLVAQISGILIYVQVLFRQPSPVPLQILAVIPIAIISYLVYLAASSKPTVRDQSF